MNLTPLMLGSALAQPCPSSVGQADITKALADAEGAWAAFEAERFNEVMDDVAFSLPCVNEVIPATQAARYHRLQGLRQFIVGEEERAAEAFAASRSIDPDYEFPETLVPSGHAVRDLYGALPLANGVYETLPVPLEGAVLLDGTIAEARPTTWPTIAQVQDATGAITATAYVLPTDAMPAYEGTLPQPTGFARIPFVSNGKQAAVLGTGLALGVAAGAVYGVAAVEAAEYEQDHPGWTNGNLVAQEQKVNRLVVSSVGLGVVAAGTVTAGFVVEF